MVAARLYLIFGLLRIVNLSHGALYLFGGYIGFTVAVKTGKQHPRQIAAAMIDGGSWPGWCWIMALPELRRKCAEAAPGAASPLGRSLRPQ